MDTRVDHLGGHWLGLPDRTARDPSASCGSRLERRCLASDPVQQYCLFTPAAIRPRTAIPVAVHGVDETAGDQVRCFAPLAEAAGMLLVAPVFAHERFPYYQRLGRVGDGFRADLALNEMLRDVRNLSPDCAERVHLFGHAGGGQFVHRYVMAQQSRVERYAVSSVGAYTAPDPHLTFPFGIRPSPELPELAPEPREFLAVPGCILGSGHAPYLRRALIRTEPPAEGQGLAHLDHGRRWAAMMNRAAGSLGLPPPIRFTPLPSLGTAPGARPVAAAAVEFLLGATPQTSGAGSEPCTAPK